MGMTDKARHALEEASGRAQEALGEFTDDEQLQAHGETQQREAKAKRAAGLADREADDDAHSPEERLRPNADEALHDEDAEPEPRLHPTADQQRD